MKKIKHIIPPCRKCLFNPKKYVTHNPCPQCKRDGYSSYLYIPMRSELVLSKEAKREIEIFKKHIKDIEKKE